MTYKVYKNSSAWQFSLPICKIFYTCVLMINIIYAFGFFPQEILLISTLLLKVNKNTILARVMPNTSTVLSGAFSQSV